MLVVTRAWNSVTSVAFMRRALALALSYARERRAFGASLSELPLHVDTLAGVEAEVRGAFLLAFELVELMGRQEAGDIDDEQRALLRLLTPVAKLVTAKQAVAVVSECIEAFGGAGYVEDTGLPLILRDAQVLPIWEGTTNVLSLDALLRGDPATGLAALGTRLEACVQGVTEARLARLAKRVLDTLSHVQEWLRSHGEAQMLQANARRLAMTIGRTWQLALLIEHAQWEIASNRAADGVAAAARFATMPVDLLANDGPHPRDSAALLD